MALFFLAASFQELFAADSTDLETSATVVPSILIDIEGGRNVRGKNTRFANNLIDFGKISFTNPENIPNGDAFRKDDVLTLEAVLDVAVDFNGTNQVNMSLSKLKTSSNPFSNTSFSLFDYSQTSGKTIFEYPQANRVTSLRKSGKVSLHLFFDIAAEQTGRVYDQFQLEVSPQ